MSATCLANLMFFDIKEHAILGRKDTEEIKLQSSAMCTSILQLISSRFKLKKHFMPHNKTFNRSDSEHIWRKLSEADRVSRNTR